MMCSKLQLLTSWLPLPPVSYRLALQYYHHPDHKHKVLLQLQTIPERSQESQRTKAFCLSHYKISERNKHKHNTPHHVDTTISFDNYVSMDEKDDAIHLYDESRKGTLYICFYYIARTGCFLFGKGCWSTWYLLFIAKKYIMRMDVILLLYHIMRSEILHPEPPIINPTDNVWR